MYALGLLGLITIGNGFSTLMVTTNTKLVKSTETHFEMRYKLIIVHAI
jgi:hypothetical protein